MSSTASDPAKAETVVLMHGMWMTPLSEASTLCTIATVTARGRAHINTAYFAWTLRRINRLAAA